MTKKIIINLCVRLSDLPRRFGLNVFLTREKAEYTMHAHWLYSCLRLCTSVSTTPSYILSRSALWYNAYRRVAGSIKNYGVRPRTAQLTTSLHCLVRHADWMDIVRRYCMLRIYVLDHINTYMPITSQLNEEWSLNAHMSNSGLHTSPIDCSALSFDRLKYFKLHGLSHRPRPHVDVTA